LALEGRYVAHFWAVFEAGLFDTPRLQHYVFAGAHTVVSGAV